MKLKRRLIVFYKYQGSKIGTLLLIGYLSTILLIFFYYYYATMLGKKVT